MRRPRLPQLRALRSLGYALEDFAYLLGRIPRALASGAGGFRARLSPRSYRRLGLALASGVLVALAAAFAAPRLPCALPGGDECAPADDAATLVPADAVAYVHVALDPESEQYRNAETLLESLPTISEELIGRALEGVPGPDGGPVDFAEDIAPWFGEEAAVALLPGSGALEEVVLLQEDDAQAAGEFASAITGASAPTDEHEGIEIATGEGGVATASIGGFLVLGPQAAVRRVAEADALGAGETLAEDPVARELREELPAERVADAYLSEDGMDELVAGAASPLASLEPFVHAAASRGAAAAIGAREGSFEVALRSSLDEGRASADPGFFAAFSAFTPELPAEIPADALAYVGIDDPGATAAGLLAQATAEAPGLAAGFAEALGRLRELGQVDVEGELLPALAGEAAVTLQPATAGERAPAPSLGFVADDVDPEAARAAIAQLQAPLVELLDPGSSLQAPVLEEREVEGVELHSLSISPVLNLTYALVEERLAIATQPGMVEQVIRGEGGLGAGEGFREATAELGEEVSLLAYLDLAGLLGLAEDEGLAEDPAYVALAPEIRSLRSLGLAVKGDSRVLATDARVSIDR